MNILISGGTGFIGSHLTDAFKKDYHHVYILSRQEKSSEHPYVHYVQYDSENYNDLTWARDLPDDFDLVYNFSGATLNHKWSEDYKEEIVSSRLNMTNMLYQWLFDSKIKPLAFINASAVGYYPTSKLVEYDEYDILSPNDFISEVVNRWEHAAEQIKSLGIRTIYARFGLILDRHHGALKELEKLYKVNLGGNIASSRQWYSWIHIDDVINALYFIGLNSDIEGPVNITAPIPVRQKDFSKVLSAIIGKPNFFKTPAFLLQTMLGERAMLITEGQKVHPRKLLNNDFKYLYPTLDQALEALYDK